MKSRFLIILSTVSLLTLVGVQSIFIAETFQTKKKLIMGQYKTLMGQALEQFEKGDLSFRTDSVLLLLDNLALDFLFADPDTLSQTCGEAFQEVLGAYGEPERFIRDYLEQAGEETSFSYHLQIRDIFLKDLGFEQQVYPDSLLLYTAPEEALLVGSYTHSRNFYRMSYDILISFRNLSSMVLKEMGLILGLTILMVVLVFSVFFVTLRNMLLQRRLSERKTDFINNMTHELKTPLSTIAVASSSLGNRELIQKKDKVEALSSLIKKQNKHLSELIDRILDINIWEKDQVRLKYQEVDIEEWIGAMVDSFHMKDQQAEIRLDMDLQGLRVQLDEVHLSTALNNLLSNAVRYGHPPVLIQLRVLQEEAFLHISVTDNGPGIPREDMKHIFEKFYRGRDAKERVIRGLGLGLYYVKQICEAHGGHIQTESEVGKGCTMTIEIPIQNGNITG